MAEIPVRFVPHSAAPSTASMSFGMPSASSARSVAPTRRNLNRTLDAISGRALRGDSSPLNRVNLMLSEKDLYDLFGEVPMDQRPTSEKQRALSTSEMYVHPTQALEVPDALADSVAFAYIPRPAEYYAPIAIPPHENIYHLRISDVAMVLNAPRCHRNGWTGRGVKVAMADSGFFVHPWFQRMGARLIPTQSPGSGPADIDHSGHGTGEAANIFTMAPDCTVFGVKSGSSSAATLEACVAQSPDVMTNSWGYDIDHMSRNQLQQNDPNMFFELVDIENVLANALADNISVLFAAGNGHHAFPGCHPDIISVGGVTVNEDGSLEASSYASAFQSQLYPGRDVPDFCGLVGRSEPAPMTAHVMLPVPPTSSLDGENFPSGQSGTGWGIFSGTSAACPQAAGLVALLKQIDRSLTPAQIKQVIAARTVDITQGSTATGVSATPGPDLATGAGLIDALRACGFAAPTS